MFGNYKGCTFAAEIHLKNIEKMKKFFIHIILIFIVVFANAQDVIVKKNGEEINSKILEVGINDIKYKKFDNQEGPTYTESKSEVFMIKYENGSKDMFDASTPKANQNESTRPAEVTNAQTSSNNYDKSRKRNYFMLSYDMGGIKLVGKNTENVKMQKSLFMQLRMGVTHNFGNYVGWDIFSFHFIPNKQKVSMSGYSSEGWYFPFQIMTGVRGYSPVFAKNMSGFFAFNAGAVSSFDDFSKWGFCYEIETGISLTRKFFVALVLNNSICKSNNNGMKSTVNTNIWAFRLGFHF